MRMHKCKDIHTHAHTHARMHAHTHARTHARSHARTRTLTRAHTHARTHPRTHAHTHARTRARTRTLACISTHERTTAHISTHKLGTKYAEPRARMHAHSTPARARAHGQCTFTGGRYEEWHAACVEADTAERRNEWRLVEANAYALACVSTRLCV